jgi:outer membrane protein OmpA-like peptidoglycan-associated protein
MSNKGVKKIALAPDNVFYPKMGGGKILVIPGGGKSKFTVTEWLPGTTDTDKNKILWRLYDSKKNDVIVQYQGSGPILNYFSISKKLSGAQVYYLGATLTGKPDDESGLLVRGYCPQKIVSSSWSMTPGGADIRKKEKISYGEDVNLSLVTEGLNGFTLTVVVYSRKWGTDKKIFTYTNIECVNGEVNFMIRNTFTWFSKIGSDKIEHELYVRVCIDGTTDYIKDDHNDDSHARYLEIKPVIYNKTVKQAENNLPVKIGESDLNIKRFEPCSFTVLKVIEGEPFLLFDEGKLQLKDPKKSAFSRSEEIYYDFNKWAITSAARPLLDKLATFLLESPYVPVELGSHTDIRGTDKYNMTLSEKRAQSAVDYLVDKGVSKSRIVAKGYGKSMPAIKGDHLTEAEHQMNRRTTILFRIFENNAESIVYETFAGDAKAKKKLPIIIQNFKNKGCIRTPAHDNQKVKVIELTTDKHDINPKYELTIKGEQIETEVYSDLSKLEIIPLQYIWPILNPPNKFLYYINSCRYFSNPERATIAIVAYSDIKWDFHFFLNMSEKLSVKWQKLSPKQHEAMQKQAGRIGAEKRWEYTKIDFGVVLEANWNKSGATYGGHYDATLKYSEKIKWLFNVFASLKELSKAITDTTKGTVKKLPMGLSISMLQPNFCLGAEWQLQRGQRELKKINEIGTEIKFYFKADPLIGLEVKIDLLDAAVQGVAGFLTGGAANLAAKKVFDDFRDWMSEEEGSVFSGKMYIDLIITGTIQGETNLTINTKSDQNIANAKLGATLKAEIDAGVEVRGKITVMGVEAFADGKVKATGTASVTFGHNLNYDERGLNYRPELKFDGLKVKFIFKVEVGVSVKKGMLKTDKKYELYNYEAKATLIPEFDVIENLEKYAGVSADIPLIRNS